MPFLFLIASNLMRQKIRTALTVLGISIGITTVVALGVITNSAKGATEDLIKAGAADFSVGRAGVSDFTFSTLTEDDLDKVRAYPEVEYVTGILMAFSSVGANSFFLQAGVRADDFEFFEVPLKDGRTLAPGATHEIMLGSRAASDQNKAVGDTIEIRDAEFTVVGIYDIGVLFMDSGAFLPLATVQETERQEGVVTLGYVSTVPGTNVQALADRIEEEHPDLATLVDLSDVGDIDQGIELIDAINLGITGLAIFIGGIAVMNTMVMAVFERTREFGILRALGWRTRRILQMVLGESLLLSMIAAVFGSLLAVALTRAILLFPTIRSFIEPEYTPDVFLRGLIVGIGVALLGAIYPAYRAARLSPAQAIRHE